MLFALSAALLAITETETATTATATVVEDRSTISPDRPGFADSAWTVPKGRVQLELGARADFADDGMNITAPSILLRVGLNDFLEVRVAAPDVAARLPKESGGDLDVGVRDLVLGLKVAGHVGDVFAVSVVPFVSLPTGTKGATSGGVDGGAGINFELSPLDFLQIGWNVITSFIGVEDSTERTFNLAGGLSLGFQFTDSIGAFAEGYVLYSEGGKSQPSVAGGLTYLVTDTFQLDLSGGTGLGDEAESPYAIAGAAFLF